MAADELIIGNWTLYQDGDGNLVISNGTEGVLIRNQSPIQMFVRNKAVICDGDPVQVANDQGTLNGTTKQGGPGSGWTAAAYWSDAPDGDSNLTLNYDNPS